MRIFVAFAIIGFIAFQSDGVIRKCIPLRLLSTNNPGPTVAPTTAGPPSTTVNVTEVSILQNQVVASNNQFSTQLSSSFLKLGSIVTQVGKINANKTIDNSTKTSVTTLTSNLTKAATGARRRKRQTGFTIPDTCQDAKDQAIALTEQLQNALDTDLGSIISYLQFIKSSLESFVTTYESVLLLSNLIDEAITMLQASTTYRDLFATAVQKLLSGVLAIQEQMCTTVPGQTTTLPTTISVNLGTSSCSTTGSSYFYKAELSGAPILAGTGLDGRPTFIGHITVSGTVYPGGLNDYTSTIPGLYFTRDYGIIGMAVNNVTYLEHGNCNCYWISNTASLSGAYIVNYNSGYKLYGYGRIVDSTTLTHSYTVVGRVDLSTNKLHYLNFWTLAESVATTFEQLVCISGSAPTTSAPTTVTYTNHTVGISTELGIIGTHISAKHSIETSLNALINNVTTAGSLLVQFNASLSEAEKTAITDMVAQLSTLVFTPSGLVDLSNCPQSCTSCFSLITPITQVKALGMNVVQNFGNAVGDMQAAFGHIQFQAAYASAIIDANTMTLMVNTMKSFVQYIRNLIIELDTVYAHYEKWFEEVVIVCGDPPNNYYY